MATGAKLHTPGAPLLPRRFGRYALFDFIGKGGMAEIYLARAKTDLGAARLCVVKQILPDLAAKPAFAEMLIHEAKLAARLSHANVVQVFDLGRADDRLYIAMEYVEGFDLNDLLRRCSRAKVPLPFEFATRIVADALRGLDYAHRRVDDSGRPLGIVHRDVSPSNILLSFEGEVKVCDFGIAHANDIALTDRSSHGDGRMLDEAIAGKAGYMSPEHARGEPIDARADVFAAGIVLWELVAGRRMYKNDTGKPPLLDQARAADIPELPHRGLPNEDALHAIVHKALAVDRDERYASAGAMLRAIEDYMMESRLVASAIRFGEWLVDRFGAEILEQRRARERAVDALDRGAPVTLVPLPPAPTPLPSMPPAAPPAPSTEETLPHIASTPPPTPMPPTSSSSGPVIPRPPPSPIMPRYGAAIATPQPRDVAPNSVAAVDVSPPSRDLPALRAQPARPPQRPYVLIAIAVFVLAGLVVGLLYWRLHG